jgi:hypothetical protein
MDMHAMDWVYPIAWLLCVLQSWLMGLVLLHHSALQVLPARRLGQTCLVSAAGCSGRLVPASCQGWLVQPTSCAASCSTIAYFGLFWATRADMYEPPCTGCRCSCQLSRPCHSVLHLPLTREFSTVGMSVALSLMFWSWVRVCSRTFMVPASPSRICTAVHAQASTAIWDFCVDWCQSV